jgi:hypothetical protein
MNLLSRKLMGSNCQRSNWLADVRRPERKKPNLAGWAFCFLLDESWCRLPVSNWPPDDYKSTALPNELSRRNLYGRDYNAI